MNLAYKYPTIFWDCANLIVDSGAIEGIDDKSANYNKIANAVNKIQSTTNTRISLVDINLKCLLPQMLKTTLFIMEWQEFKEWEMK